MKFTDGFWQLRPGVTALYAQEAYDICAEPTADADGAGPGRHRAHRRDRQARRRAEPARRSR